MKPSKDTADFLKAILWAYPEGETGKNPMAERSVYDFAPEFIAAAEAFLDGFREYLADNHPDLDPDSLPQSFGGNVYFSLSGHGVGFWDSEEGEPFQAALEAYSGGKHRFEEIDLCDNDAGKLDLAFLPEFLPEYRARLFTRPA